MKKIILFIALLFIPFMVNAKTREIKPTKEFNTGYAYAFYKDGYIYGALGRAENNYIEKMTIDGETVYKIENTVSDNQDTTYVFNDEEYFYIVDFKPLEQTNHFDVYTFKYKITTGEKIAEYELDDFNYVYSDEVGVNDESIGLCYNGTYDKCIFINLDTFETEETPYRTLNDMERLYDREIFVKQNNIKDINNLPELKELIESKELWTADVIDVNDYYFLVEPKSNGQAKLITYIGKDLEYVDFLEVPDSRYGHLTVISAQEYNNKLVVLLSKSKTTCLSSYRFDSYYGGPCGGPNVYVVMFNIIYDVFTKTDGRGEIKVSSINNLEGSGVEFEIIPKEGYVLSEVKVIDADGNVITFTENKFKMPSADVTIEATFVKAVSNPVTKDVISYLVGIALFALLAIVTIIKEIRIGKKLYY